MYMIIVYEDETLINFYICMQSIREIQKKLWYELISLHLHYLNAYKIRITKGKNSWQNWPLGPYFSITNVEIYDSYMMKS